MSAQILDGKETADRLRSEIAHEVQHWVDQGFAPPKLAAILVGEDPASQVYVRNKERACEKAGMHSQLIRLPAATTTEQLLAHIQQLNCDPSVHGILVQLPLPRHVDTQRVLDAVHAAKDVDAFAPENVGLLVQGRPRFLPCTPHGVVQILARYGLTTSGKHVVVIGRSDIVGKPLANMLVQRSSHLGSQYANATVTIAHSQSNELRQIALSADILVAAVGVPQLVKADMVKTGAVVIDVGINRVGDRLVGDVDFDSVRPIASAITPVPGGIGPLTIAMLLRNTLTAAQLSRP